MRSSLELRAPAALSRAEVAGLCERLGEDLRRGEVAQLVCDAGQLRGDLGSVELLARLSLTARRAGIPLRLLRVDPELRALLVLVGLEAVLPVEPDLP